MNPPPIAFALDRTPLAPGITVLEASAGTGKTFTIAGLFLRLLLEARLTVDQILVVTFTRAATAELRQRIRQQLASADRCLRGLDASNAPAMLPRVLALAPGSATEKAALLRAALESFDQASICTLDSFCRQVLQQHAFESQALFEAEFVADSSACLRQLAEDFWRRAFYGAEGELEAAFLRADGFDVEVSLELLRKFFLHPRLVLIGADPQATAEQLRDELRQACHAAAKLWRERRETLTTHFGSEAVGWKNPYGDDALIQPHLAGARAFLEGAERSSEVVESLRLFTTAKLDAGLRARKPHDIDGELREFARAVDAIFEAARSLVARHKFDLLASAREQATAFKEGRKVFSFDDLRTRLAEALRGPAGASLAAAIRQQFRAGLIDEFQDTDPVQFDIFRAVFAEGASEHQLYLVGDPKQAIYSFRGADVFAYLRACGNTPWSSDTLPPPPPTGGSGPNDAALDTVPAGRAPTHVHAAVKATETVETPAATAERRFTLNQNWRSETGLVNALNAVFQRPEFGSPARPFLIEKIEFHPATAAGQADRRPLVVADHPASLQILFWEPGTTLTTKPEQEAFVATATAAAIARLLTEGRFRNPDEPATTRLRPSDIAVLTNTHAQAELVQAELRALGIPSVQQTRARIGDTREAAELQRLLQALATPADEAALRSALLTDLLGWTADRVMTEMDANSPAWTAELDAAQTAHRQWEQRGFMAMLQEFLRQQQVRTRLLGFPDGERRLTNLLHLAELLQRAALEEHLGRQALVDWLARLRQATDEIDDEHLLRLESDDRAVQLVTIHNSKGLEYPVVLCPFLFGPATRRIPRQPCVVFHDAAQDNRLTCDVGAGTDTFQAHEQRAEGERFAEGLRLTYVALTRARHRCYLVWGPIDRGRYPGFENSPLGWLLHPPPHAATTPLEAAPELLRHHLKPSAGAGLETVSLRTELRQLSDRAAAHADAPLVEISALSSEPGIPWSNPEPPATAPLAPREFHGRIDREWGVASFTSLTRYGGPDTDALWTSDESAEERERERARDPRPKDPFRGAAAGSCVHAVFEQYPTLDADREALSGCIRSQIREWGFRDADGSLAARVLDWIERTLDAVLPVSTATPFRLAEVPLSDWHSEVAFHLPLRRLTARGLSAVFARHGHDPRWERLPESIERLRFDPVHGFLTGTMDLVFRHAGRFYLVDWKTNDLGDGADAYRTDRLAEVMLADRYFLQYHLYTLALDQHLRRRVADYDYERHFGGVFYVFMRGVNASRDGTAGIFHDTPRAALVRALAEEITGSVSFPAGVSMDARDIGRRDEPYPQP